jgi:hypothetical protein
MREMIGYYKSSMGKCIGEITLERSTYNYDNFEIYFKKCDVDIRTFFICVSIRFSG